jgi:hypothetical protein
MKVLNSRTKPRTFKKKILTCDLLVMDMLGAALNGSLDDIERVVKVIKDQHTEQPKAGDTPVKEQTLVLVSTVMTWINTPKKAKKQEEGDSDSDETGYFTDQDYAQRAPTPKYQ